MADQEAQDTETIVKDEKEEALDIESQINSAMRARFNHFKEQSDSLTFEGVRRLLEKDLGLERLALDVHKRFIKQLLQELLEGVDDGNDSKNYEESGEKRSNVETAESVAGNEQGESPEGHESNSDVKESISKDAEKMDDSPVLGLLTGKKTTKLETEESKGVNEKKDLTKGTIKTALRKRAGYLKDNSEQITLAGLRRLLEEDLELEMYSLDPFKKFIKDQVDEVLNSSETSQPATNAKKKVVKKKDSPRKVAKKVRNEESSDSDEDEDQVKPRKKSVTKGKDSNESKKRKKPTKDTNISGKKRIKAAETLTEDNSDAEDNGIVSEDDHSQSSAEKSTKKKVVSAPAYGKRVEHLKSVIKACGMSVPPSVYKKVKQVPENKREAHLVKELEEILSKEGLTANPTEKEIKEVRKRKERAKELEGIDTSNIVSSTRRRSTTSFVPPPRPKIPVENDGENTDDDEDDEDDEDNDNGDSDDSQSEESNEVPYSLDSVFASILPYSLDSVFVGILRDFRLFNLYAKSFDSAKAARNAASVFTLPLVII
ncbi:Homeodomain-like containing protein [Parasponia andersonii]|uniref:Homeodomain-like containing protein n=1 Tax=Parasponia andersonii TaxID=3476 RepID=A0A2P5BDW5_PARAD|nr:Homeodomain-like containing protein [Parasponia andersonii]